MSTSPLAVKTETITPLRAKELLSNNRINRALKKRQIENLARTIKAGNWDAYNGETIIVDTEGCLLDGQHRLQAVVLAGLPIDTFVTYGVDPHKRGSIDTGFRRSLGDFFDMHGYPNGRNLASAVLWMHAYDEQALQHTQGGGLSFISYSEANDYLHQHDTLYKFPMMINGFRHLLPPAAATALTYLFAQCDTVLMEAFVEILSTGNGRENAPNFWLLRERLIKHASSRSKFPPLVLCAWAVQAWNATRAHRILKTLRYRMKDPFPVIK